MKPDDATPGLSKGEVEDLYRDTDELEQSQDAPKAPLEVKSDVPGADLFNGLVKASPFSEFLHYKALANYGGKPQQDCIRLYSAEHRCLACFCTLFDFIFRLIVVAGILGIAGMVVWGIISKTLYQ